MKKFKFKDGIVVTAETVSEAKEEHRKVLLDYEVTSMATVVKTSTMSICTIDDEHHIGNPYFKVYKGTNYQSAEKMCRISFEKPEYIVHTNNNGAENWILNSKERKQLVKLLNKKSGSASFTKSEMSNWELAIVEFNKEKGYTQIKTEKLIKKNPKYIKDKDLLPFNLPMPDYTQLP